MSYAIRKQGDKKYDIIILKLQQKIKDFKDKMLFMQFQNRQKNKKASETQKQSSCSVNQHNQQRQFQKIKVPQRHAALLIGVGEQQHDNKKTMIFKKSIGQMSVLSSNKNYFIPLEGQERISGSPIFMFTQYPQKPFIVGIYTSLITYDQQHKRYGAYEKFDKQYFKEIKKDHFYFQNSKNYQFNQDFYNEYIKQAYVTYDHFLLRLIAQILKLNHYHFYLKSLKMSNLILNIENSPNILFNDLQLVRIDKIQKRDDWKKYIKESQSINFAAFKEFAVNLYNKSWIGTTQSQLIKFVKNVQIENFLSLKSFFINLPRQIFQKIGKELGQKLNYKNFQKQGEQSQQFFSIYKWYFNYQPKYHLDKLIMSEEKLMSDKGNKYNQSQFKNQERYQGIQDNIKQKQIKLNQLVKKQIKLDCQNQSTRIQQFTIPFLYKLFKKGAQNFLKKNIQQLIVKQKKDSNRKSLQQLLKTYTNGIIRLTQSDLKVYQKEELRLFDENYQKIVRWAMIEEILEYFECLDNIIRLQKETKK